MCSISRAINLQIQKRGMKGSNFFYYLQDIATCFGSNRFAVSAADMLIPHFSLQSSLGYHSKRVL